MNQLLTSAHALNFTFANNMFKSPPFALGAFVLIFGTAVIWHLLWHGRIDIDLRNLKIIGKGSKDQTAD